MKIFKFTTALIALSLTLAPGCGKEEEEAGKSEPNSVETIGYVKIDVRDINLTRADEDYENGTENENKIESVIFMFFTDKGLQTQSPKRISLSNSSDNPNDNAVEVVSNKIVTLIGSEKPAYVLAIVNAPEDMEVQLQSKTMSEVRRITVACNVDAEGPFMMTNTVYRTSGGEEICATPITEDNIFETEALAAADDAESVDIYVERVNAKLNVRKIKDTANPGQKITLADGSEVTLSLDVKGIEIGKLTDKTYLYKDIRDLDDSFNRPGYYRFNWANTPAGVTLGTLKTGEFKGGNSDIARYLMENTLEDNYSQLVITYQLKDKDREVYPLVLWQGQYYSADSFPLALADALKSKGFAIQYTADGETKTESIPTDYLMWATADEHKAKYESGEVKYYHGWMHLDTEKVTAALSEGIEFIDKKDSEKTSEDVIKAINDELYSVYNRVYYWNDGLCYMFTPIKDIQMQGEYNGVVRNTVYDIEISSTVGLGVPSFDPELEIDYDVPNPEWFYMGARIKVLKWRISKYNVGVK